MRIIAGSHRGRRLCGPPGVLLRPTSDKVREALFSILGPKVTGCRFLDLYAGTGAVGIEAISRGAALVTFVESVPKAAALLRKNVANCQFLSQADIRVESTHTFLHRPDWWNGPYDVLFADPPYAAHDAAKLVLENWDERLMAPEAVMILEQHSRATLPLSTNHAALIRRYGYGDTALFVYSRVNKDRVVV